MLGILGNAINRADLDTLWRVEMANTLGTARRVNFVMQRAIIDCAIRAFRLADVAINALRGDLKGHNPAARDLSAGAPACGGC